MTSPVLIKYAKRRPIWHFMAMGAILIALYLAFFAVDPHEFNPFDFDGDVWDFSSFTDPDRFDAATHRLGDFIASFSRPDFSSDFLSRGWELTWQTLSAALLAVAIGIVCGYLLALGAARSVSVGEERGPRWLRWFPLRRPAALVCAACRLVLDVLRAVPDFAWAVLLVPLLGIGPMTGMLALAISTTGILGKIYSEIWDSADPRLYENVRATGAGRFRVFLYGIRPLTQRSMLSYTLMRSECAIRNAAVIGAVGGGGVGAEIKLRLDYGEYDRVATMVLFTLALTLLADLAANFIRRQLRTDPNHPRAVRNQSFRAQVTRKWIGVGFAFSAVAWSAWYQLQPHPLTVQEPQLQRLTALFEPKGWQHMTFFKDLLKPDLDWTSVNTESSDVRSHFIARKDLEIEKFEDRAAFLARVKGLRLALGPPDLDASNRIPRKVLEQEGGVPVTELFSEVIETGSDAETFRALAEGRADIGAIEWESWGAARKDKQVFAWRKHTALAFTTLRYEGTKIEPGPLQIAVKSATVPVAMAIVGTLLGVLGAMLLCYPHSIAFQLESHRFTGETPALWQTALRWLQAVLSRMVAVTSRAIPEVMWAMFFMAFFGMGVVAGAFAIAVHTMGLLTRVFGESVDNIPYRRFEQGFAGSRVACFGYTAVPTSWRDWMTYSFFQFESNVRIGVVLGIIGSAGLGFIFSFNFEHFHYERASTDLIVIILLTVVIDRVSRLLKLTRVAA
ncbi:MAG: ABC transporter permease subunit [Planctomycetes bacterium]|nr:ABC transporter permease subunit [Planctomycetota bacterium]